METRIKVSCLFIFLGLINSFYVHADEQSPDWWKAQRDVVVILMEQKKDIAVLAAQASASKPKTGQEAMFKLNVLMRGGLEKEAVEAARELKRLCPDLDNHQVASIYYAACGDLSGWELAKVLVEIFADNISEIALHNRLLKHLLASGYSVEELDQWLASMPKGKDYFWLKERLSFNLLHGRGEPLVQEISDDIRGNPQDIPKVLAFLDTLAVWGRTDKEIRDLSWMVDVIKPTLATEAADVASRLKNLANWAPAVTFYKQAMETPLTEQEVQSLVMMCSVFVSDETIRAMHAAKTREEMAGCLVELGQSAEAQKWMVEAADIRDKHNLGRNALFAGKVQAASGERVIEGRIREEEAISEDDPEYWRERAQYYSGRNETVQQEEALKKGLALTSTRPGPGQIPWRRGLRSLLLRDYALFLAHVDRTAEAVDLLRKEIEQAPAGSESAKKQAALLLGSNFAKYVRVEDGVLWTWLASRPKWEYAEERLLRQMLESAKRDDLDEYLLRAEELAREKGPVRTCTLGYIMTRLHFPERSIPLLEYTIKNAQDQKLKKRAEFTLFESYLGMHDWQNAEQIFPDASKQLSPREITDWYSRIAVAAAKSGEKADAMRIWREVVNIDTNELRALRDLVKAGLRDELIEFYSKMQKDMPSSEIPAKALEILNKK